MQFAVPQFTDVEDKLIGPLTLKQFLSLLATSGLVLFFWSIFGFGLFFFVFGAPVGLLGAAVTFAKFNGKPFFGYVLPFISFIFKPKVMIFKREAVTMSITQKKERNEAEEKKLASQSRLQPAEAESRLRKLAYLLDQKTAEENTLIGQETVNR